MKCNLVYFLWALAARGCFEARVTFSDCISRNTMYKTPNDAVLCSVICVGICSVCMHRPWWELAKYPRSDDTLHWWLACSPHLCSINALTQRKQRLSFSRYLVPWTLTKTIVSIDPPQKSSVQTSQTALKSI